MGEREHVAFIHKKATSSLRGVLVSFFSLSFIFRFCP